MKKTRVLSSTEATVSVLDYIVYVIIALMCFLTFQQGDIMHTAGSSYGFLQGHILDYYDWVAYEYNIWDSYMPSTYILFALWNIPIKLLGLVTEPERYAINFQVLMWYKLLPTLFFLGSGMVVYKIAMQVRMGARKAKLCAYAFLTAPIAFFSQFMFGQYDSFTVFFLLLGLLCYLRGNRKLFILFMGIAIPFKLWPLLFFVPLLLLREKNIWKIIRDVILVVIPYVVEFVLFYGNDVFKLCVLNFGATTYMSASGIDAGGVIISYMILLWGFICAWAYFTKPENEVVEVQWIFFLCAMVIVALFGLSQWHPQWLMLAMPFLVLSAFINKNPAKFLFTDIVMMLFYSMYVVNAWPNHVDQELFAWGIFGDYIHKYIGTKLMMRDIYLIKDMNFIHTVFTALLVVSAIFKHPVFCSSDFSEEIKNGMKWLRVRFLAGVGIFVIPAVICFISAMNPPYLVYETEEAHRVTEPLAGRTISQVFVSPVEKLDSMSFRVATYARKNDVDIEIAILENATDEPVYTTVVNAGNFEDNNWVTLDLSGVSVEADCEYRLEFRCENADENQYITFYRTEDYGSQKEGYAMLDGEKQDYHICFRLYAAERNYDDGKIIGWVWDKENQEEY